MRKEDLVEKLDSLAKDQQAATEEWKHALQDTGKELDRMLTSDDYSVTEHSSVLGGIVRSLNQVLDTTQNLEGAHRRKTVESIIQSSGTYLMLQRMWPEIKEALDAADLDRITEIFSPEAYKGVLDSIFGFGDLPAMISIYKESINTLESYRPGFGNLIMPLEEFMKRSTEIIPNLLSGNFPKVFDIVTDFQKGFEDTASRLWHLPIFGTDKQKLITESSFRILKNHGLFLVKLAEMQQTLYKTSILAAKRLFSTIVESENKVESFEEFFDLWASVNEDVFVDLFKTTDYARLQGELVGAALDVRAEYNKILELYLEDTPIVVRSEIDSMYKTIYDMKKRIRQLEKTTKRLAKAGENPELPAPEGESND